jgi:hypothetical protein
MSSSIPKVKLCDASFCGLRHYRKSALPRIIFNRLVHLTGYYFCHCNRFLKKNKMYGVVNDDCLMCRECCDID